MGLEIDEGMSAFLVSLLRFQGFVDSLFLVREAATLHTIDPEYRLLTVSNILTESLVLTVLTALPVLS